MYCDVAVFRSWINICLLLSICAQVFSSSTELISSSVLECWASRFSWILLQIRAEHGGTWKEGEGNLCSSAGLNLPTQHYRVLHCTQGPGTQKSILSNISEEVVQICQMFSLARGQKPKKEWKKKKENKSSLRQQPSGKEE